MRQTWSFAMTSFRLPGAFALLLATTAAAQTTGKPLNLKLPPSALPAASASAAKPSSSEPGLYYGDTSGRTAADEAQATDAASACDDATYNDAQVHGSVSTGVVAGSHVSGNYQGASVNISKALGSCEHPTGGIDFSVSGSEGHFHGRGRGH
jgi:hypothetical protein